jgi:hypothetical protein
MRSHRAGEPHPVGILLGWAPPRPLGIERMRARAISELLEALVEHGPRHVAEVWGIADRTLRRWVAGTPELRDTAQALSAARRKRGLGGRARGRPAQKRASGAHSGSTGQTATGPTGGASEGSAKCAKSRDELTAGQRPTPAGGEI